MRASATQKHFFYTELAKLVEAGFGIREAADVMLDTKLVPALSGLLHGMKDGLAEGKSIAQALGGQEGVTQLERSLMEAGEQGGRLAMAFQHLADYFGMVASARREVVKAMVYPAVLLHVGVLIGIVPMAFMREDSAGAVLGSLVFTLLAIYLIVALLGVGVWWVLRRAPGDAGVDRLLNRLPWVGKARSSVALARFTKVYHICLLAGLSMEKTIRTAAGASFSGSIREAGIQLEQRVKQGESLGPAFLKSGAFPPAFAKSYATAEASGSLDKDLERWSRLFQTEAEQGMKTLSAVIPKLFYFLILAFVAWKIISFYSSYYGALESIGE